MAQLTQFLLTVVYLIIRYRVRIDKVNGGAIAVTYVDYGNVSQHTLLCIMLIIYGIDKIIVVS